jgi:radical SAM/Cys-rich protein
MDHETVLNIMMKAAEMQIDEIEITGGAPEMNPHMQDFIEFFHSKNKKITVRSNLTVLEDPRYSHFLDLYTKYNVKIIASLPDIDRLMTDKQRGNGTFESTIRVLKKLNDMGYGTSQLHLDLVSNPPGDSLPAPGEMEKYYRLQLLQKHNVSFNNFIAITNNPIKRFKKQLEKSGRLKQYMELLEKKYNPDTIANLMCRSLVSVDYQGYVYDCDFSLAEGNRIAGYENRKLWEIDFSDFQPNVTWFEYCHACTAAQGSGCYGALAKENQGLDYASNSQDYYGSVIQKSADLVTQACCDPNAVPDYVKPALSLLDPEITDKFYGCGSPLPEVLEGRTVLDLGCGTGRDIYVASKLVSETGFCYGIDLTENQIAVAKKHVESMTEKFGYSKPNIKFIHDKIENVDRHIDPASVDIVISNCVLNLLEDKEIVLKKVYKLLKFGGELYFSDVFVDRRLSDKVKNDPLLHGECLGGAMYVNDFIRAARRSGFMDPRTISSREVKIDDPKIHMLTENTRFYSITYRLWKIENLEDKCEDFGHIAIYKGGCIEAPYAFTLDDGHVFFKNKPERVCGNTALMVGSTRFAKYFDVIGNFNEHFGEFTSCSTDAAKSAGPENNTLPGCGC